MPDYGLNVESHFGCRADCGHFIPIFIFSRPFPSVSKHVRLEEVSFSHSAVTMYDHT